MDAITLLKNDHKEVERLFKRFEKAGDRAFVEKREIVDRIVEALSTHAAVEEQLFYPVARATVPDTDDIALESLEEHHIVKWVLSELDGLDPHDERFDAKVTVLIENVRHHVEEEEQDFFPKVRGELGRRALNDLGDTMFQLKGIAPTRPHPTAPDTPPGNLVVGVAAGVADRVTDTVTGAAHGTVNAVQDLVARIRGQERPRQASPTGSSTARKAAADVRAGAVDLTDAAIEAAQAAKEGAEQTVSAARAGTKGTATAARKGTKRTATAAKSGVTKTSNAAKSGAKRTASAAKRRSG